MLMRQHTRAALFYLMLWDELFYRTKAVFLPFRDWIRYERQLQMAYPNLPSVSRNIRNFEEMLRTMDAKLSVFNKGTVDLGERFAGLSAVSILEGSAILTQEGAIASEFGRERVEAFRTSILRSPAAARYYGALMFIDTVLGGLRSPDVASYLLFAALCGNFQEQDATRLRYPTDLLTEIALWLRSQNFVGENTDAFQQLIDLIDGYFEKNHGVDLIGMLGRAQRANEGVLSAFDQIVEEFEEKTQRRFDQGRLVLKRFTNFVEASREIQTHAGSDPESYCSTGYLQAQRQMMQPVIFIESESGIPITSEIESLYYVQNESRIEVTPKLREVIPSLNENVVRIGHVISPRYGLPTDEVGIDVSLWQQCHDLMAGCRFLAEGPAGTPAHLQRDVACAFGIVGTKIYTSSGEIEQPEPDPTDHRMPGFGDEAFREALRELKRLKARQ
jgi:hypothetical protein